MNLSSRSIGLIALLALLPSGLLRADYDPWPLFGLIGAADVIAVGEVTELSDSTFVLKPIEVLKGFHRTRIEVLRFRDWACARRCVPYEIGQQLLVFCRERDERLHLMGAGGEGELFLVGKRVYTTHFSCGSHAEVRFGASESYELSYPELRDAILDYRWCFHLTPAKTPHRKVGNYTQFVPIEAVRQAGAEVVLRDYSRRSPIHKHIIEATRAEQTRLEKLAKRR